MRQLGYTEWNEKDLVIFGSGKVGTGLITYGYRMGASVTVITDPATLSPSLNKYIRQVIDYRNKDLVDRSLQTADAVVTATGIKNALSGKCSPATLIASKAILANMGVEDEYGPEIPESRVLRDKQTLNFILEEPTHLKYIDATMALHNEGAHYIALHKEDTGLIDPPLKLEEKLLTISRQNGCIQEELELI